MAEYNIRLEFRTVASEANASVLVDALSRYHPSVSRIGARRLEAWFTVLEADAALATTLGLSIAGPLGDLIALEVLPATDFDKRNGTTP
jgi:hypothetical protein